MKRSTCIGFAFIAVTSVALGGCAAETSSQDAVGTESSKLLANIDASPVISTTHAGGYTIATSYSQTQAGAIGATTVHLLPTLS